MPGSEYIDESETQSVQDVLNSQKIMRYTYPPEKQQESKAGQLEAKIKKFTKAPYAHAVVNGTAGVSCLMAAAGVGYGDEVIVPPFTFVAPIEAVMMCGAIPVFAEIDDTLCLNASGIEATITEKTKAVLVVHMCGISAEMDAIKAVCKKHKIHLLEDAGQAFGSSYKGVFSGLHGFAGAFSFDAVKIITCGEGGACITKDAAAYEIMDQFSDHGHDHQASARKSDQHPICGLNFRIGELSAAFGLGQIKKINQILSDHRTNKILLKNQLSGIQGISFRKIPDPAGDSGTFLTLFVPSEKIAKKAEQEFFSAGLGGAMYWYNNLYHYLRAWDHFKGFKSPYKLPLHEHSRQNWKTLRLPKSDAVMSRAISFGIQGKWSGSEIEQLADTVKTCIQKVL